MWFVFVAVAALGAWQVPCASAPEEVEDTVSVRVSREGPIWLVEVTFADSPLDRRELTSPTCEAGVEAALVIVRLRNATPPELPPSPKPGRLARPSLWGSVGLVWGTAPAVTGRAGLGVGFELGEHFFATVRIRLGAPVPFSAGDQPRAFILYPIFGVAGSAGILFGSSRFRWGGMASASVEWVSAKGADIANPRAGTSSVGWLAVEAMGRFLIAEGLFVQMVVGPGLAFARQEVIYDQTRAFVTSTVVLSGEISTGWSW
jgi:hypothetical protein